MSSAVSALLVLTLIALTSVAAVMLLLVLVMSSLTAAGIAREEAHPILAIVACAVPLVALVYVFKRPRAFAWIGRYMLIGVVCLSIAAALTYFTFDSGAFTS